MNFNLHTTRKVERDAVLETESTLIDISPHDLQKKSPKPIVWEEDTGRYYEHTTDEFFEALEIIDKGGDLENCSYIKKWMYKGGEPYVRIRALPSLYGDIKKNGIQTPVEVEATGERLNGSFRSKIAIHLGIPSIQAKLFTFNWCDVTEDFLLRKLEARWLSSGKDYYEFDYGNGWKNVKEGGRVYQENAERWDVLKDLIHGKTLDLGCNEGYLTLKHALRGNKVEGWDIDLHNVANLNRLIFEWVNKKDIDAKFIEGDLTNANPSGFDTILLLNVIYHLPREKQIPLLRKCKGKNVVFQCNLRKERERNTYYGSHPDDLKELIREAGLTVVREIEWRDKPIIIAK